MSSWAARLPTLLVALLLLWVTARLGQRLFDRRTGLVAAAFVGSSVAFQLMVADPKVDLLLTTCAAATVLCAVEARQRPAFIWLAWACAGLGFLAKGPIGVALPAIAVLPEAIRRPWREGVERGGWWARLKALGLPWGPALTAGFAVLWFWLQFDDWGWGGVRYQLWEPALGRYSAASIWKNDAGPLFFVHTGLWAFLPFAPVLAVELGKKAWALARTRALPPDWRRLCVWWFAVYFAAISSAGYKLPQYLFPTLPAAALLAARGLATGRIEAPFSGAARPTDPRAWWARVGHGLMALVPGLALVVLRLCFPSSPLGTFAWVGGLAGALLLAAIAARALDGVPRVALLLCAPLVAFAVFYQAYLYPSVLAYQPAERLGQLARASDPSSPFLPFLGATPDNASGFYSQKLLRPVDEAGLRSLVDRGEARVAVLSPEGAQGLAAHGWKVDALATLPSFPTSRPTRRFLFAASRPAAVEQVVVAQVRPP